MIKRLDDSVIKNVRMRFHEGGEKGKDLAKEVGVSGSVMHKILTGKTYKHVPMRESWLNINVERTYRVNLLDEAIVRASFIGGLDDIFSTAERHNYNLASLKNYWKEVDSKDLLSIVEERKEGLCVLRDIASRISELCAEEIKSADACGSEGLADKYFKDSYMMKGGNCEKIRKLVKKLAGRPV